MTGFSGSAGIDNLNSPLILKVDLTHQSTYSLVYDYSTVYSSVYRQHPGRYSERLTEWVEKEAKGRVRGRKESCALFWMPVRKDVLFQSCATNICLLVSLVNLVGELVEQNAIGGI